MTNEFFAPAFKGTNFGSVEYAHLIHEGLMKVVCGYWNGYTMQVILEELGYTKGSYYDGWNLTKEGQVILYKLYESFSSSSR